MAMLTDGQNPVRGFYYKTVSDPSLCRKEVNPFSPRQAVLHSHGLFQACDVDLVIKHFFPTFPGESLPLVTSDFQVSLMVT